MTTSVRGRLRRSVTAVAVGYLAVCVAGLLTLLALSLVARRCRTFPSRQAVGGIRHFQKVDDRLYRGGRPSGRDYELLAGLGIRTIVDLRSEANSDDLPILSKLGISRVHIPIRDGQAPSAEDVARFLLVMRNAGAPVFMHCGAGVGRTGAMTAVYLVNRGRTPREAMLASLAVGPPTLAQGIFQHQLRPDECVVPAWPWRVASSLLDAPRVQIWTRAKRLVGRLRKFRFAQLV